MSSLDDFKAVQRARWATFAPLQALTTAPAARLVEHARIAPGACVLDVACGTGVVSVTAATRGARVTGLDLTPELLVVARENAETAGVAIDWHEGDVEALPFADQAFDVVVSQFGHMFAPRPAEAIGEMLRVLKPGGTVAFSTWPPDGLVGRMAPLISRYLPPPPVDIAPPALWGDPSIIRERLGDRVQDIAFDHAIMSVPTLSIPHYRQMTERTVGTVLTLVESLRATDPARLAVFCREYDALVADYFEGNLVTQAYLLTRAIKG